MKQVYLTTYSLNYREARKLFALLSFITSTIIIISIIIFLLTFDEKFQTLFQRTWNEMKKVYSSQMENMSE